ncbi:MAG: DUF4980 domain-containing protein, partial [Gemmataceae bacterium]|nr:DUF4980 domain-containing protein [Gemmataceae bacterium]
DHIVQSDAKKQAEVMTKDFEVSQRYLNFPVKTGAPMRRVKLLVGKEVVREFDVELAADGKPDFLAPADVSAFKGKKVTVEVTRPADAKLAELVTASDAWPEADKLYQEKYRPQFHFTSRVGWLNDPNGLVYADGEWHLFYQHNPFGREWGNMHWGHATSKDLFRWKEEGVALYPKKYGDWAFSGSAVVDKNNTSGWGTKEKPPLVLAYTSTGRGECVAYSTDGGKSWKEHDKNPVVKHAGRDPKLVWYEKGQHWVMAVYDEFEKKQWIAFYTSPDLKEWTFTSRIEGFYECPDLFKMSIVGFQRTWWVLYAADGKYLVGDFDGKEFKPAFKDKKQLWYGNFYAAQTFDNAPMLPPVAPGRTPVRRDRVQVGWARGVTFPGTPFNQQMTVPVDLSLQRDDQGELYLGAEPVAELATLRDGKSAFSVAKPLVVKKGEPETIAEKLDAFEVHLGVDVGKTAGFDLDLRGTKLTYDPVKKTLTCKGVTAPVPMPLPDHFILWVLVDRGSVEVFIGGGRVAMSVAALADEKNTKLVLTPTGGDITISTASLFRLKSAWEK